MRRSLSFLIVFFLICGLSFAGEKGNWSETLLESRADYQQWWAGLAEGVRMGPWYLPPTPPKQLKEANVFPLKKKIKLGQWIDVAEKDKAGEPYWAMRVDLIDGEIHYDLSNHGIAQVRTLPDNIDPAESSCVSVPCDTEPLPDYSSNYAENVTDEDWPMIVQVRNIISQEQRTVKAYIGVQNGVELWLNGEQIFRRVQLGSGLQPKAEMASVDMELNAGDNQLVFRYLGHRWEGFYFSLVPKEKISPDPFFALLAKLQENYPVETARLRAIVQEEVLRAWFRNDDEVDLALVLEQGASKGGDIETVLKKFAEDGHRHKAKTELSKINLTALRRAVLDLRKNFPQEYSGADGFLKKITLYEKQIDKLRKELEAGDRSAAGKVSEILKFQREVLLSNPLLDFDELLLIKRRPLGDPRRAEAPNRGLGEFLGIPQQSSWQLDRIRQPYGWENEISVMNVPNSADEEASLRTLYRPPTPRLISDIDLHWDSGRLLFSMPGSNLLWQLFEMNIDGSGTRQLSPKDQPDVHNFDGCYLPSDKIVFVSTAPFQGVPCSDGIKVAMNYVMDADGGNIKQLCFDQDHDYCPTVMNDGKVLYLRWDYTDLPHQWPRILFTMNPDGTGQREFYGSGSYWPNAIFYARPVPGHPSKVVGVVTGHHVGRVGELVVLDPALGRHEADGVVQRIPGFGEKVEPVIMDKLTQESWPKFLHPYPLSDKYFIVSCKPGPDDLWGIYLVDVFDNFVLLKETEGYGLFEPMPLRKRPRPPVIAEQVIADRADALLYIEDIYKGPGLRNVPRGQVKNLRLFTYHFAYPYKSGGQHRVGADGPWEPKILLGTVPVEEDGSAFFRVPADTPISMQPLDGQGMALQLMRSWTTAKPGEVVSCIGCHESQNAAPAGVGTIASSRQPSEIAPWHGPTRGFSFNREVQPVLDKHCAGCHDGSGSIDLGRSDNKYIVFGFRDPKPKLIEGKTKSELAVDYAGVFEPSYIALRSMVRVGGLESDLHILNPGEFGAETTELIQMLMKGHYGVKLNAQDWERLYTWIDLNAPCHGTWHETLGAERIAEDHDRRFTLRKLYGGSIEDPEVIKQEDTKEESSKSSAKFINFSSLSSAAEFSSLQFDIPESMIDTEPKEMDLGNGLKLEMVYVSPGEFTMGDDQGFDDEKPLSKVTIANGFWMSRFEITNEQFAIFDPSHESRMEHGTASFNSERAIGPRLDEPDQPVVRVSWDEAMEFCRWLTERIKGASSDLFIGAIKDAGLRASIKGVRFTLPTEAQWEYACRAGADTPFSYGGFDEDFSKYANLSDATMNGWATYNEARRTADIVPRDGRFDDKALVSTKIGSYAPNKWGLHDMHGNVFEWTRSAYLSYPYNARDGRNAINTDAKRVARGGSWYDRPKRARSAFRLAYPAWQRVYNVGFRVIVEIELTAKFAKNGGISN
jgi:formylglycine-generating enzyme required for sulfatase activity